MATGRDIGLRHSALDRHHLSDPVEINDEYDEEVRDQIKKDGDAYILDGLLAVRDAKRRLKLAVPEDNRYTTIAGFLMSRAGRLLEPGETVEHEAGVFTIERVDNRRISRIRVVPFVKTEDPVTKSTSLVAFLTGSLLATHTAASVGSQIL